MTTDEAFEAIKASLMKTLNKNDVAFNSKVTPDPRRHPGFARQYGIPDGAIRSDR